MRASNRGYFAFAESTDGIPTTRINFNRSVTISPEDINVEDDHSLLAATGEYCDMNVGQDLTRRYRFPKKVVLVSFIITVVLITACASVYFTTRKTTNEKEYAMANELIERTTTDSTNCKIISNHQNITKQDVLKYFQQISDSQTISGVFVSYTGRNRNKGVDTIYNITNAFPGLISTGMPIYYATSGTWTIFTNEVIYNWKNGSFVRIEWWAGNPLVTMTSFTDMNGDVEARWNDLVKDGGRLNTVWKQKLDLIVPYLHKLQTAGVITIFDIIPVINKKMLIWKGRPGVNGTMKLYKITHDYLTKHHNLTSLIWTWSLHVNHLNQTEEYWPGVEYVDVVSVFMSQEKEMSNDVYQNLIDMVGLTPVSMEEMQYVPTPNLLTVQPRWTWFTATDNYLDNTKYNSHDSMKAVFGASTVVNRGKIDLFSETC